MKQIKILLVVAVLSTVLASLCRAGNGDDVANGIEYTRFDQYVSWSD